MKIFFISLTVFFALFLYISYVDTADAAFNPKITKSFGGKVLITPIPGVTCIGTGQAIFMSSNIKGAVNTAKSATSDTSSGDKAFNMAMGIYNMIPTYTTDPLKKPKIGGFILGKENAIPDFKTCKIGAYPIPVLKTTSNYGVSKSKPTLK